MISYLINLFNKHIFILVMALALGLTGCGGGGSGGSGTTSTAATELQGVFLDSAVAGMAYSSGSLSGITGADGTFLYEQGATITFKIGDIVVGTATAQAVMTPVSLVTGAVDETNPTVTNIVQFLLTLDSDGIPGNGIQISASVATAAIGQSIDFTLVDFDTNVTVTNAIALLTSGSSTLVLETAAQDHLNATLISNIAGIYNGNFSGDSSGTWSLTVGSNGNITGSGCDISAQTSFSIVGTVDSSGASALGFASDGSYTGNFSPTGNFSGTWAANSGIDTGTFTGSKANSSSGGTCTGVGGVDTSAYAGVYTGTYTGDDTGTWTFTINSTGNLEGAVISDTTGPFSITASVSSTGVISGNGMTGTISSIDGTISGTWPASAGNAGGTYSGNRQTTTGGGGSSGDSTPPSGSVVISGADTNIIGTAYIPVYDNDSFENSFITSAFLYDANIYTVPLGTDVNFLIMGFLSADDSPLTIGFSRVTAGSESGYNYVADCLSGDDCSGVSFNRSTTTVTFTDVVLPPEPTSLATGAITLNGTVTFSIQ